MARNYNKLGKKWDRQPQKLNYDEAFVNKTIDIVSETLGVTRAAMLSKSRYRKDVHPRAIVAKICHDKANVRKIEGRLRSTVGWTVIKRVFGLSTHASAMHWYKIAENNMPYRDFKEKYDMCKRAFDAATVN